MVNHTMGQLQHSDITKKIINVSPDKAPKLPGGNLPSELEEYRPKNTRRGNYTLP